MTMVTSDVQVSGPAKKKLAKSKVMSFIMYFLKLTNSDTHSFIEKLL